MSERWRELLELIVPRNPFYAQKLAGIPWPALALHELPFTTKEELLADQRRHPPYGTNLTFPRDRYSRLHQTSGTTTGQPLRWLDTPESWRWMLECWHRYFDWMRLGPGDRLFFAFSFGPFLGFWTAFEAAVSGGWFVLPAGGMSSSARLRFLLDHQATVVFCTPTYALHLAEVAQRDGLDLTQAAVRLLVVAGEPGGNIPEVRARIEAAWQARVIDHSGMTEIGPCATEPWDRPGGLQILTEEFLAEVIDPQTLQPLPAGSVGELVLTNLGRLGSPLIRYRTGDLVRAGRDGWLQGGILGRCDDMLHLRGNNVYPSAIEAIIRRWPEVAEFRLILDLTNPLADLRVEIECVPNTDTSIVIDHIGKALRDELLFRAEVVAVPPGTLPRFEMKSRRLVVQKSDTH
ncbi:MAG: AMP-binding protein [Gemmataceae bacterium]|nr:AMP-binding protein [Gemmataceae bacterium]